MSKTPKTSAPQSLGAFQERAFQWKAFQKERISNPKRTNKLQKVSSSATKDRKQEGISKKVVSFASDRIKRFSEH